jgi:hypothetical protein
MTLPDSRRSVAFSPMTVYQCHRCPLAFGVGCALSWDLTGGCAWYICTHCGTMHRIDHPVNGPDKLYAYDGPIRALVEEKFVLSDGQVHNFLSLPLIEHSWRLIKKLPTAMQWTGEQFILPNRIEAVALNQLPCTHCGQFGGFGGMEAGFGDNCPVCKGPLELVYAET